MSDQLRAALADGLEWLNRHGVVTHHEIIDAIKTVAFYQRSIETLVRDLYRGGDLATFEDSLVELIDQQLDRAWREGMRLNDLDPAKDMTPEFEAELEDIKLRELDYVTGFGEAVQDAAQRDEASETPNASLQGLYVRGNIWSNRYTEVVNTAALVTAEPKDRLEWIYGDTEHCETCAALNGIVASKEEWDDLGIVPQSPPNESLACGGWHCQCELRPTDKKRSRNRLEIFDSLRI